MLLFSESKSGKHAINSIPGTLANGDFYAFHLVQFSQVLHGTLIDSSQFFAPVWYHNFRLQCQS